MIDENAESLAQGKGFARRVLLLGGFGATVIGIGGSVLATPAYAATYTKSINAFQLTLNCSSSYNSSGSQVGYSVSSGKFVYTRAVSGLCRGYVGITEWGFVQLNTDGYSVSAFSGGVSTSSTPALTRTKSATYPNNQVRTKTVSGKSYHWRTFGIAVVGLVEGSSWNYCAMTKQYFLYQPYYNRWLSRSQWGPWLPV